MKKYLRWFLIIFPIILVFKNFALKDFPAWGDAPFFYKSGFNDLFSEPTVWTLRGSILGGINNLLWLSPLMAIYGALGKFLMLSNGLIVRLIFYFPSVFLSGLGPYFFAKYLKLSKTNQFFLVLTYLFNTYYLLIIDGGQVGIGLAYGIFPLVLVYGKKVFDNFSKRLFFGFLFFSFLLTIIDPRIITVAFITLFVWQSLDNWQKLWILGLTAILLIPLNLYWLLPLFKIGFGEVSLNIADLRLSSLLNAFLLYAPHWPANEFGKVVQPYFYFAFIPFLIFGSILLKPKSKTIINFALVFLFFAFLSKGSAFPLGNFYDFLINKVPIGFAFRDSSKFFIPLVFFGGILMGKTIDLVKSKIKIFPVFAYLYLLFLIYPALAGNLNFVLGKNKLDTNFQIIADNLDKDKGNFKTLWFSEKHPLAYETRSKPAFNAKDLVSLFPFASLNASNDVFNFLNNFQYIEWLKTLGFKYLFLSGDPRNKNPSAEDAKNWQTVTALVDKALNPQKLDWAVNFPIYEIQDVYPEIYSVRSVIVVVGPMLNHPFPAVYLEDGKVNPSFFIGKDSNSLKIFFNDKDENDLAMFFLQKYFVSPAHNVFSEWAYYDHKDYLNAKYELFIRGYSYNDFDYGKGLAFSTFKNESIKFRLKVPKSGKYIIAIRSGNLDKQGLSWRFEEVNLAEKSFEYIYRNKFGFEVLNVVALVPYEDFKYAQEKARKYINNFKIISKDNLFSDKIKEVSFSSESGFKYGVEDNSKGYWLIFNESYHPLWSLKVTNENSKSIPIFSTINGFYKNPEWNNLHLEFQGQKYFRYGALATLTSIVALAFLFFLEKIMKNKINLILKTKTVRQSIVTATGTILNGLIGWFFYVLVARNLGPEKFGVFSLATATIALLSSVFNVGVDTGLVRFVGKYFETNKLKAFQFMKLGLKVKLVSGSFLILSGWFTVPLVVSRFFVKPELIFPLRLALIGASGWLLFFFIASSFQATQRFLAWSGLNILTTLLRLLAIACLFLYGIKEINFSLYAYISSPFIGFLLGLLFLPKFLTVRNELSVGREFFHYNKWIAIFTVIAAVSSRLDTYISARLLSLKDLGIYSVANNLSAIVSEIVLALATVVAPKLASFRTKKVARVYLLKLQTLVLFLSFLGISFGIPLGKYLIPKIYGLNYFSSVAPFAILLISQAIFLISVPVHTSIYYFFSQPKIFVFIELGHLILVSLLGWWAISSCGYLGAALTMLIGNIFNFIVPAIWVLNKFQKE